MTRVTVLVPTHDHETTLPWAVGSALRQTVTDLEVLVVGDGAPPATDAWAEALAAREPRLRYLPNRKGPRHGELHRHAALREARGEVVCYLSDDDLWLPDHVERLLTALPRVEFAHCLPAAVRPDATLHAWAADLSLASAREQVLGNDTLVPLSCVAHTLDAYRRLPFGWRTTPDDRPTDRFMWHQFLEQTWVRAASSAAPTCLHFASPERLGWSGERRAAELAEWDARIRDARWRKRFFRKVARWTRTSIPPRPGAISGWEKLRRWVGGGRAGRAAR
ncbi:MAG: glycosyltransferase family 2 protein [Planctomycetaceae bacterium]